MKVVATAMGFDGQLRQIGDEFEVPEGITGSWFKPVDGDTKKPAPAKPTKQSREPDPLV